MSNTTLKHPVHYTVFQPNVLLNANNELRLAEIRLYTEILNFNHQDEPDRLIYEIPYNHITNMADDKQISRKAKQEFYRVAESMQRRVFHLDEEFMLRHFGEKKDISIVPFPQIEYETGSFKVHIWPLFKKILTMLETGFTKGDIVLLRQFHHKATHRLYWLIRLHQWRFQTVQIETELGELKELLGCPGQYKGRFDNFRNKILEPAKEELAGTWAEFEYDTVRGGRGGAVKKIILHFRNDYEQEKRLAPGEVYDWEKILESYGIEKRDIVRLRHLVSRGDVLSGTYRWNDYYVHCVIDLVKESYVRKTQNKSAKPIKKMGAYIYKTLTEGWLIDQVEERRAKGYPVVDKQLDVFQEAKRQEEEAKAQSFRTSYESFKEMYGLHKEVHKVDLTEQQYARDLGYRIEGEWVVKIS